MKKIILTFIFLLTFTSFAQDIDKQISQKIILGFNGNSVNSKGFKDILKQVQKDEISGVILFQKNIKSKEELIKMNEALQNASKTPVFVAIDNEGGKIQRFDFYKYKSAKEVSKSSLDEAKKEYSKMADDLSELKINFNFAPCVDLSLEKNSIISKKERSYGDNPKIVSDYSKIFIEEMNKKNIITSIKHFPGHGNTKDDTHKGFVNSTETFLDKELEPYSLLKSYDKMNTVMVSHIFNKNFDEKYPASLSKKTIDFLKNDIGFKGVIVSDDLDMGAIKKNYSLKEIIEKTTTSGVDILIFSNNIGAKNKNLAKKIHKIIKEEIKKGNIQKEDIETSYKKIMALKETL